MIYG